MGLSLHRARDDRLLHFQHLESVFTLRTFVHEISDQVYVFELEKVRNVDLDQTSALLTQG